jgi:hypothetical protein
MYPHIRTIPASKHHTLPGAPTNAIAPPNFPISNGATSFARSSLRSQIPTFASKLREPAAIFPIITSGPLSTNTCHLALQNQTWSLLPTTANGTAYSGPSGEVHGRWNDAPGSLVEKNRSSKVVFAPRKRITSSETVNSLMTQYGLQNPPANNIAMDTNCESESAFHDCLSPRLESNVPGAPPNSPEPLHTEEVSMTKLDVPDQPLEDCFLFSAPGVSVGRDGVAFGGIDFPGGLAKSNFENILTEPPAPPVDKLGRRGGVSLSSMERKPYHISRGLESEDGWYEHDSYPSVCDS